MPYHVLSWLEWLAGYPAIGNGSDEVPLSLESVEGAILHHHIKALVDKVQELLVVLLDCDGDILCSPTNP